MAGQATLFESSVPLTVAHLARHDMRPRSRLSEHRWEAATVYARTRLAPDPRLPYIGAMNLCLTDREHIAPQPVLRIARSYNVSQSTISRL